MSTLGGPDQALSRPRPPGHGVCTVSGLWAAAQRALEVGGSRLGLSTSHEALAWGVLTSTRFLWQHFSPTRLVISLSSCCGVWAAGSLAETSDCCWQRPPQATQGQVAHSASATLAQAPLRNPVPPGRLLHGLGGRQWGPGRQPSAPGSWSRAQRLRRGLWLRKPVRQHGVLQLHPAAPAPAATVPWLWRSLTRPSALCQSAAQQCRPGPAPRCQQRGPSVRGRLLRP